MLPSDLPVGWDFSAERRPPRSTLRSLAPIGVGTGWVESLSGFIVRLARRHSLSPRALLERVVATVQDPAVIGADTSDDLVSLAREVLEGRSAAINGAWGVSRKWTTLLGELTLRSDLAALSLGPWSPALDSRGLLRAKRAYCPACLDDWRVSGQPIYEPLRWQFQALEICVAHKIRLRTACPNPDCEDERRVVSGWARPGACGLCGTSLWRSSESVRAEETAIGSAMLGWQRFVDAQLSELLAQPPLPGERPRPEASAEIVALAVQRATGGLQRRFAEKIGMTESSVSYWKDSARQPSLHAWLRICRAAGFRLRDVLLGDLEALRTAPVPQVTTYIPPSTEHHRVLDERVMEHILQRALRTDPPPTLASIYADMRVDQRHVRRRFPLLCKAIRERRAAYDAEQAEARRSDRERVLLEAIRSLHAAGVYPSRNHLQQVLPSNVRLQERRLYDAWRAELVSLGYIGDPPRHVARVASRRSFPSEQV